MDDKAMSCGCCKKRVVGLLFSLLMLCFAVVFLTFAIKNVKTMISDCKKIYYCLDYNFINRQTDEDIVTRAAHLRECNNEVLLKYIMNSLDFCNNRKLFIDINNQIILFLDLYRVPNNNYRLVRLYNGYLSVCAGFSNMERLSDNVINFHNYLKKKNIEFIYVIAPHKNYKYLSLQPYGVKDYENENCERMIARWNNRICYLDNREIFKQTPQKHYDYFYKIDTHWKVQYVFLSYCQIMTYMAKQFDVCFEKELQDINNFSVYTLPDRYESELGGFFRDREKMLYLKPLFPVKQSIYSEGCAGNNPITGINYRGPYDMSKCDKFYPTAYVVNPNAANRKKLMVIGDSFSPQVMSLLSLSFTDIEFHSTNTYEGILSEDIERFKPDYVICIFTSRQVSAPVFDSFSTPD